VDVTADSAGVHITVTNYYETTADAGTKTHGVTGRTTFAAATFDPDPTNGIMSNTGQEFFNANTDVYSGNGILYSATGNFHFLQQSYDGVCHNHHIVEPGGIPKDDVFAIAANNVDTIQTSCGGSNQPAGQWSVLTSATGLVGGNGKCTGKRVASYSKTLDVFRAYTFVGDSDPDGGSTDLTWKITTVEMAEIGDADGTVVARYHTHSFTLGFSTTAAITVKIDSGNVMPPAMLQVTGMNSQREATPGVATLTWTFDVYVRQGQQGSQDFLVSALGAPTLTIDSNPSWGSTTCTAIEYTCDTIGITACGRFGSSSLPSAIMSSLTTYTQLNALQWRSYTAMVSCVVNSNNDESSAYDLVVPPATLTFSYSISDSSWSGSQWSYDAVVTDTVTPPTLSFTTSTTLPADESETVALSITGSLINLNDLSGNPSSLIQHIDNNQANKITSESVAWSQAVGFQVAFTDETAQGDRQYWHLVPQFILITAHSTTPAGTNVVETYDYIHPGHLLPDSWCGINSGGIVGAMVLSDAGSATGTFIPSIPAFQDYISVSLKNKLTTLLANNKINNTNLFNFAGLDSWAGWLNPQTSSYVVSATDGSYVVPMRNRLKLNTGVGAGFALQFCAITHMEPTAQVGRRRLSDTSTRRLLSTEFSLSVSALARAASSTPRQVAMPSTVDLETFLFEAEPYTATITTTPSKPVTNGGLYAAVFGGLGALMAIFGMMACWRSSKNPHKRIH